MNGISFDKELMRTRDNEKPRRRTKVHAFQAQGRPITNEEVSNFQRTMAHLGTQS